jgi:hypothetical protein
VQDALTDAGAGDEIWVAEGVLYVPGLTRKTTFHLKSGVALYGGFDPDSGADTFTERNWETYVTVLSGDLEEDDITNANGVVTNSINIASVNAWTVVMGTGVTDTARLDGFTITAGNADGIIDLMCS